jgi:DNA polymerase elongation subunit (family B)
MDDEQRLTRMDDDGDDEDPSPSFGGESAPQPLCSVLNTVVDYLMVPPTPLEPVEFRQQWEKEQGDAKPDGSCQLLVPLLRIFGPIIRRDRGDGLIEGEPVQTACLYVHGAFPYLLARPVIAGPDGSLHRSVHRPDDDPSVTTTTTTTTTDWDDPASVQRILSVLQEALEEAIQQSSLPNDQQQGEQRAKRPATRVLRRITVVMGRGFYTYSPGPAAPFLRVEYYCPADRWKVKRCLERGLQVPDYVHPDPVQYQATVLPRSANHDVDGEEEEPEEALRFHCYEAHIPYTMQFFKDYNLAGCSYMHLEQAKFRLPLPTAARRKLFSKTAKKQDPAPTESLFLRSNTPANWVWEGEDERTESVDCETAPGEPTSEEPVLSPEGSSLADIPLQQLSPQQSLSPSTADNAESRNEWILSPPGIESKATVTVRDSREAQYVQEHQCGWTRMQTSCDVELDVSVDSILNVLEVMTQLPDEWEERQQIHWRAVPSLREIWSQERRRMAKLLKPQDDFLSRSEDDDETNPPPFTLNVKKDASLPGAELARDGMERLVRVSDGLAENFRRSARQIVSRHSEAVSHVDSLLRQRRSKDARTPPEVSATRTTEQIDLTPSYDETMQALDALGSVFDSEGAESNVVEEPQSERNRKGASSDLSFTPKQSQDSHEISDDDAIRLSQSERFQSLSQNLDYDTEREAFELSQRVERGDGIVDGPFEHIEDLIDPETLTPYEAIDDEDGEDDEDMDEDRMEEVLTALATQTLGANGLNIHDSPLDDESSVDSLALLTKVSPRYGRREEDESHASDDVSETAGHLVVSKIRREIALRCESQPGDADEDSEKPKSTELWKHAANAVVECRTKPPTKKELKDSARTTSLYPTQTKGAVPSWTAYVAEYETIWEKCQQNNWFPRVGPHGVEVQPTRSPPSRKSVVSWSKKQNRRSTCAGAERQCGIKRRPTGVNADGEDGKAAKMLRIDENSRKLVSDAGENSKVEEVEWEYSQQALSATQEVDNITDRLEIVGHTKEERASGETEKQAETGASFPTQSSSEVTTTLSPNRALQGIGNQGGRIWVDGGGQLKAKTKQTQGADEAVGNVKAAPFRYLASPVSMMVVEIQVQCRTGKAGASDSKQIAMTPDSDRDKVLAVFFVHARDPGGGEPIEILEKGCIFVPVDRELESQLDSDTRAKVLGHLAETVRRSTPTSTMGVVSPLSVECVKDERQLLLRLASIVRLRDPDILLSWDTQGSGLGYLIERGVALGKDSNDSREIDMARLLGRTPTVNPELEGLGRVFKADDAASAALAEMRGQQGSKSTVEETTEDNPRWKGSGLGSDWDDRVGAGAAAASIVRDSKDLSTCSVLLLSQNVSFSKTGRLVFAAWKIVAEEVKHPNCSYLPAVVSSVLDKRIPYHDNIKLMQWYGHNRGRERWRVFHHRLSQATACLHLFDALDVIGRSGEAARLSGVEFSQSFPGIRGSQYKVEGVLLRALKSLNSEERGSKKGRRSDRQFGSAGMSLSEESKTQSPWKARRQKALSKHGDEASVGPEHNLSDRSYFFFSPSLQDTNNQEALEAQALTLEPLSGHQEDPVVVCDFTALYPSLVIAYNLCYSTCAGRLDYHSTRSEMRREGKTTGKIGPFSYAEGRTATILKHHMPTLEGQERKDRAYIAPTGTIYVSEAVVKGVLPQVLDELLSTRAMLKKASKQYKKLVPNLSPSILRQLEARQLALKYVANVTYGTHKKPLSLCFLKSA